VQSDTGTSDRRGFLQLCADRRYHRKTMVAFERATGLKPDEYWIEARAGGSASWGDTTRAGRLAYGEGASAMGWAGHGDRCGGFPGESNAELRRKLERTARKRAGDFPRARHYLLFGEGGEVEVVRL
jgi:hypothetical protein